MKRPVRLALLALACCVPLLANDAAPPRVFILSDIEADPDDTQSLVRLLLYSDCLDIEGLVATTSTWKRTSVAPESMHAVIRAYAKVHPNLLQHDRRYPQPDALDALVKSGRPAYGMSGVGEGKDSEGSDWLIHVLDQNDERPLWISIWGGANTLAQALHKLRATRSAAEVDRLVAKLRVYTISDQDDSGPWLRKEFPNLFYIVTPGGDYGAATWSGINSVIDGIDNTTISNRWIATHLQQGHGPLGAAYPDVAWGVEGDTPSFLGLIPNGLNAPEHPDYGGWGGRYELHRPDVPVADPKTFIGGIPIPPETRPIWTNAIDTYAPPQTPAYGRATRPGEKTFRDFKTTLWRWRDDFQNDFAARMDWTTKPYAEANHLPVPVLDHPAQLTVKSGEGFGLSAHRSSDPDGDSLSFYWFHYPEAGSYRQLVKIDGAENATGAWVIAPKVEKPETLHFILRLTDKGSPALSRYQRVIVTVTP
ncbi:MAG TPA: nucleoside hydrolase-like domain-containing protein [Opitutus sp.]|nr:nucleoside hydrolase-like domain-containing protein [Opitutus sp.]